MFCPTCKKKSPTVAVSDEGLICAQCKTEIVSDVPRPALQAKRKKTAPSSAAASPSPSPPDSPALQKPSENKRLPEVAFVESPEQTVASAQAVAKAWQDANKNWRMDNAHILGKPSPSKPSIEQEPAAEAEPQPNESFKTHQAPPSRKASPHLHLILLGLFIFLIGHGLIVWAFLTGNYGAWTLGNLCSVGGVSLAIVSIVQVLRQLSELSAQPTKRTTVIKTRRKRRRKRVSNKLQ